MQKVSELITTENSFFDTLRTVHGSLYQELFGVMDPGELDMLLLVNCGERYAAPLLIHHPMQKVVTFIVNKYGYNWEKVARALLAEYDPLTPYTMKQTTTGDNTATHDTESESQDKTGVVGFDSTVATDSTVDTNNNTVNVKQTNKTNTVVDTIGNTGNLAAPDLIKKEIEMRKLSFFQLVVNDVQTQITLDIY